MVLCIFEKGFRVAFLSGENQINSSTTAMQKKTRKCNECNIAHMAEKLILHQAEKEFNKKPNESFDEVTPTS